MPPPSMAAVELGESAVLLERNEERVVCEMMVDREVVVVKSKVVVVKSKAFSIVVFVFAWIDEWMLRGVFVALL
jgi:hypothetical protein